jgi:hypothetical protein
MRPSSYVIGFAIVLVALGIFFFGWGIAIKAQLLTMPVSKQPPALPPPPAMPIPIPQTPTQDREDLVRLVDTLEHDLKKSQGDNQDLRDQLAKEDQKLSDALKRIDDLLAKINVQADTAKINAPSTQGQSVRVGGEGAKPFAEFVRHNIDGARVASQDSGKPILIHFHGKRCAPCLQMEQSVFSRPELQQFLARNVEFADVCTDDVQQTIVKFPDGSTEPMLQNWGVDRIPMDVMVNASYSGKDTLNVGGLDVDGYERMVKGWFVSKGLAVQ